MSDLQRDAVIVAAVGGFFVFLGKLLDRAFGWRRQRETFAERLRDELHEEIQELRDEVAKFRAEANEWREKYLREKELTGMLRNDYSALSQEHAALRKSLGTAGEMAEAKP